VLKSPQELAQELADAALDVKTKIGLCETCFSLTDVQPCRICANPERSDEVICVVEQPSDINSIEKSGAFSGTYHVIHGALSPLDDIGPEDLKIDALEKRIKSGGVKEIILATNLNREGEATAAYLADRLKNLDVKVSRIAHGVPMGSDIEYTDGVTLGHALSGRKEM
jgi:recombination protein RecR